MELNQVIYGDNREKLKDYPDNFFDGIITDPPYGMGFMGKNWDTFNSQMIRERKEEYDNTPSKNLQRMAPDGYMRKVNKPISSIATVAGSYDLSIGGQNRFQQWFYTIAVEMLRVAKPGTFLFCFGGTRTYHRVICAIEDAGWIIRDQMMWLYGQGFPKSTDISKQLDKEAGVKRKIVGKDPNHIGRHKNTGQLAGSEGEYTKEGTERVVSITAPTTDKAKQWEGYGTGLKPGWEPIIVAMKPLEKGLTYAQNAEKWGVAGLNIEEGRIQTTENLQRNCNGFVSSNSYEHKGYGEKAKKKIYGSLQGRWPANVILSHSPNCVCIETKELKENWVDGICKQIKETVEVWACVPGCPIRIMDEQSGESNSHTGSSKGAGFQDKFVGGKAKGNIELQKYSDSGGASRFFYCAKASKAEREAGLREFVECIKCGRFDSKTHTIKGVKEKCTRNNHPTVKPLDLMRYLCTLLKMSNRDQVILDPFCGSGTTLVACEELGINYIGIEQDMDSCLIATARS